MIICVRIPANNESERHAIGAALRRREGRCGRRRFTGGHRVGSVNRADTGDGDPDLERSAASSDEIYHINDVDRGAVWEETRMHMRPLYN